MFKCQVCLIRDTFEKISVCKRAFIKAAFKQTVQLKFKHRKYSLHHGHFHTTGTCIFRRREQHRKVTPTAVPTFTNHQNVGWPKS